MSQKGAISGPGNHQKGREILYEVTCGDTLPQQSEQADWPRSNEQLHLRHRQDPARLRRRVRRANAQATAEAAAKAAATAPKKPDTAVEAVKSREAEVVVVQATIEECSVAVQAEPKKQTSHDAPAA